MAREIFSDIGAGHWGAVPLQESGGRRPIFFVHPGDGDVLAYALLARKLGEDQPSFALRARGIDDGSPVQTTLVEMAADYVEEIRRIQPRGPYILGGFCPGGAVAFEMAGQLDAAGEQVAGLLLLDPRFPRPRGVRYDAWLAGRRLRERRLTRAVARRIAKRLGRPAPTPERDDVDGISPELARIREDYSPRPLELPATVILSDGFADYSLPTWYVRSLVRSPTAWTELGGGHTGLLLPPTIDVVAQEIVAAVEAASA
jgi:thioesterase domain-containing protein